MSSQPKPALKLDWCSHEAARYAVEHWHYSRTMPASKRVHIGVWEDGRFVGAVVFSWGANPNLHKAFNLKMTEVAELVRVALTKHISAVSRIVSIALKMLKQQSPNLHLVVSYADPYHDHVGSIYQAGNWIYTGVTATKFDFVVNGQLLQRRAYTGVNYGKPRMALPPNAQKIRMPPKHRYLYPLDAAMRKQIESLRKPYPKRPTAEIETGGNSIPDTGSANLTVGLDAESLTNGHE